MVGPPPAVTLPPHGRSPDEIWSRMNQAREDDVARRDGRVTGYLFLGGGALMSDGKEARYS